MQTNTVKERLIFFSPTVQAGKERESCVNDFEILGGLGAGAFGKVYKVKHKQSKQIYALKQISKKQLKDQKMVPQIKTEIKIMYGLHHPNIVALYNHFEENDFIYLIIEYAEGGQLWDKLNKKGRFDEKTVQHYLRGMVSAIDYCHSRNPPIIHRDIKPENILLDKNGDIKLADFGWSQFFNPGVKRKTYCGTLDYLAPEMISESGHDVTLDYWSLGVLAFELLSGKAPFTPPSSIKDPKKMQEVLEENIMKVAIDWPKDFPALAKDFISKLLKKKPKQRMSVDDMKAHPWIKLVAKKSSNSGKKSSEEKTHSKIKIFDKIEDKNSSGSNQSTNNTSNLSDNPDDWTDDELREYSKRKESIIARSEESKENDSPTKQNTHGHQTAESLFQRFSISQNKKGESGGSSELVSELNQTIKNLKNQLSEQEVKLKIKEKENNELKKENKKLQNELAPNMNTPEGKRIQMLEDEKKKLKKEIDEIWMTAEKKEAELQRKNLEIKKLEEFKNQVEKYRSEKSNLSKQVKELQTSLNQVNAQMMELKHDKDTEIEKYERKLKENKNNTFGKDEHLKLKELVEFAHASMKEMQQKIDYYKEKSESIDKLETELNEKKIEIVRVQAEYEEKISEIKQTIEQEYEDKIKNLKNQYNQEKQAITDRYRELIENLENELKDLKSIQFDQDEAEAAIDDLKEKVRSLESTNESLRGLCNNYKTLNDDHNRRILMMRTENDDLKMKIDLLKKSYPKHK